MIEPQDLSLADLKAFHKGMREKHKCAKNSTTKGATSIVLSMLDKELDRRGYDVSKLFKGYDPEERY